MPSSAPAIGTAIRTARERKRWTQEKLAHEVGVSLRSVSNWELGHSIPRNRIGALEDVLGVTLREQPAAGPLDDLLPWHEPWEQGVAEDEDLPIETRRDLIGRSRAARAEYRARRSSRDAAAAVPPRAS